MVNSIIISKRLKLRKINHNDFYDIAEMLQDMDVMYAWEYAFSNLEVEEWIDRRINGYNEYGYDYFLAQDIFSGDIVGQIGLINQSINNTRAIEIGYILKKQFCGKGYATEGAKACLSYAFNTLNANDVIADIRPENLSSIKVAERMGMKQIGIINKVVKNKIMPHIIYSIAKNDFKN